MSQRNFRAATFTRGFADDLELFAWPELDRDVLQRLTSRSPLTHLHLRGSFDDWERLDGPHFHCLPCLTVTPMGPAGGPMEPVLQRLFTALGESPHFPGLTTLRPATLLGAATVAPFARTPLLGRLTHLLFSGETPPMLPLPAPPESAPL